MVLELRSRCRKFDYQSDYYQGVNLVIGWVTFCGQIGMPSRTYTNTKVNSAFHPSGVGKSSTGLLYWDKAGRVYL